LILPNNDAKLFYVFSVLGIVLLLALLEPAAAAGLKFSEHDLRSEL
jgi:hypothetical protein